jgi:apolipoprotein N-acyltransferase
MYSSTIIGSLLAHIFNSAYMALVFVCWAFVCRFIHSKSAQLFMLISFWLGFEFLHHYWELAWPWFTLGHVFAAKTSWIQWYSFTGSLGGSAWVLIVNGLFYLSLMCFLNRKFRKGLLNASLAVSLIVLPVVISFQMVSTNTSGNDAVNVLIVQPNIHPQKEKFAGMSPEKQLERAIKVMETGLKKNTDLIVFPETMLVEAVNEEQMQSSPLVGMLKESIPDGADAAILTGAFTKRTKDWDKSDSKARIIDSVTFVLYNSALLIKKESISVYHKSRLVPLVEKQPFHRLMLPLRKFIERSGGFFGSYGTFNENEVFYLNDSIPLSPVICFESAFGNYTAASAGKSSFIIIITNDGWWSSRGGYMQHLQLARLRAIESRRWVVRCANTGVSAVIDEYGNIRNEAKYMTGETISQTIPLRTESTFYSLHHQKIEMTPLLISLLFGLFAGIRYFNQRKPD